MSQLDVNLDELCFQLTELMVDRHEKYGPGNISRHGMAGLVVRLGDKLARLEHGVENHGDESLEDTLFDIAGYALIGLLWERGLWPGQESPCVCTATRDASFCKVHNEGDTAKPPSSDQERSSEPEECSHPDSWFDRNLCGLCDSMHYYCYECGEQTDPCHPGNDGLAYWDPDFPGGDPSPQPAPMPEFRGPTRWDRG